MPRKKHASSPAAVSAIGKRICSQVHRAWHGIAAKRLDYNASLFSRHSFWLWQMLLGRTDQFTGSPFAWQLAAFTRQKPSSFPQQRPPCLLQTGARLATYGNERTTSPEWKNCRTTGPSRGIPIALRIRPSFATPSVLKSFRLILVIPAGAFLFDVPLRDVWHCRGWFSSRSRRFEPCGYNVIFLILPEAADRNHPEITVRAAVHAVAFERVCLVVLMPFIACIWGFSHMDALSWISRWLALLVYAYCV